MISLREIGKIEPGNHIIVAPPQPRKQTELLFDAPGVSKSPNHKPYRARVIGFDTGSGKVIVKRKKQGLSGPEIAGMRGEIRDETLVAIELIREVIR